MSFDEIYTIDSVDAQLQSADVVIITLSGTPETARIFFRHDIYSGEDGVLYAANEENASD